MSRLCVEVYVPSVESELNRCWPTSFRAAGPKGAITGTVRLLCYGGASSGRSSWMIAINAGEDGSVILGKILEKDQHAYGFDSQTGEYVNLISKGIIDPTKVVRVAIQNAASVAALLITTEAMVAEVPKKNQGGAGMPPGAGGMGGMGGMDF